MSGRAGVRWGAVPAGLKFRITGGKPPATKLPEPTHDAGQGLLALAKPKTRAFKAKVPTASEADVQVETVKLLNQHMVRGGVVHVANEGMYSLFPNTAEGTRRRNAFINKLTAMGLLLGFPDVIGFWQFPPRWREILEAAGETLPAIMPGLCGAYEKKRPGWKPDKAWREGNQPKAHAWLRARGVPVDVGTDWQHAWEFFEACGAPMRTRILTARGAPPRPPKPVTTGAKKKAKGAKAPQRQAKASHVKTAHRRQAGEPSVKASSNKAVTAHVSRKAGAKQAQ